MATLGIHTSGHEGQSYYDPIFNHINVSGPRRTIPVSLAHEIGHLVFHHSVIRERSWSPKILQREMEASLFAMKSANNRKGLNCYSRGLATYMARSAQPSRRIIMQAKQLLSEGCDRLGIP